MKNLITLIFSLVVLTTTSCKPKGYEKQKTSVENISVDKSNKYAYTINGMLRNTSSSDIKGYVKIKFLTPSGDVVKTASAYVNEGDLIAPYKAANFKYTAEPKDFSNVVDFEVIFVER